MFKYYVLLGLTLSYFPCSFAIKITSLDIPKWIESGTEDRAVLDCDYDLSERETFNLTIKWFYHDKTELIYEWIPRLDFRYVSSRLHHRFDWDYTHNRTKYSDSFDRIDNRWHKYRSLVIKRPTNELSGRYVCQVISSLGDDSEDAIMTIFQRPATVEFEAKVLEDEKKMLMSYKVAKVWPLPKVLVSVKCSRSNLFDKDTDALIVHNSWPSRDNGAISGQASETEPEVSVKQQKEERGERGKGDGEPPSFTVQHVQYLDIDRTFESLECGPLDHSISIQLQLSLAGTDYSASRTVLIGPLVTNGSREIGFHRNTSAGHSEPQYLQSIKANSSDVLQMALPLVVKSLLLSLLYCFACRE
ncbi:hypothetical protein HDE_13003 [Halotydeus destructor]|nr:hypothetical protein HDE_13003 [Halotydeus destructor]